MKRRSPSLGLIVLLLALTACDEGPSDAPDLSPGPHNRVLRLFQRPFDGHFFNSAPFDHNLPLVFKEDGNSFLQPWRGACLRNVWDGHNGHDWTMPIGIPLYAVVDGVVVFAGFEPPFTCPGKGETSALIIRIRHEAPKGEKLESFYAHLSEVQVEAGQEVHAGQQIGLSGNTGCSNGPHLHFSVFRLTSTNNGRLTPIDPFGWEGPAEDPWAQHPDGAESLWLWKHGEAPPGNYCCLTPQRLDVEECPSRNR